MRFPSQLRFLFVTLALAIGVACPAFGQKLQVRQVIWGFDGKVRINCFNPVSIELDNIGDEPFEGTVVLRAYEGIGQYTGARLARTEVYVQPQGRRWVQFTPYIHPQPDVRGAWELQWEGGRANVQSAKAGSKAFVALTRSSGMGGGIKGVRNFEEEIFPNTVAATSQLGSVVLDHVPRWEAPRREAFFDWVYRGGHVHLLLNDEGVHPEFTSELALLNGPGKQQTVGAGVIFRHPSSRDEINRMRTVVPPSDQGAGDGAESKKQNGFVTRARAMEDLFHRKSDSVSDKELDEIISLTERDLNNYGSSLEFGWDVASRVHSQLREITRPDHNWGLIYAMSVVYILMIFPGCYLLGRKRVHYLWTYGAILGAAALFSVLFLIVGRRGYGEQTTVNTVGVATRLQGQQWDVIQWSTAFVTRGGSYNLRHGGEGLVYSSGQQNEAVDGVIATTKQEDGSVAQSFRSAIPPFSNRPFVHRHKVSMSRYDAKLVEFSGGSRLEKAVIQVDPAAYKTTGKARLMIAYGDYAYAASLVEDRIESGAVLGPMASQIRLSGLRSFGNAFLDPGDVTTEERYSELMNNMLAIRSGVFAKDDLRRIGLRPDRIRLLAYVEQPPELKVRGDEFPSQSGYVLLSQDLLIEAIP